MIDKLYIFHKNLMVKNTRSIQAQICRLIAFSLRRSNYTAYPLFAPRDAILQINPSSDPYILLIMSIDILLY